MENRTYVPTISVDSMQLALREAFSVHGEVTEMEVTRDGLTGQPRRFSFITTGSTDQAERAMSAFTSVDGEGEPDGRADDARGRGSIAAGQSKRVRASRARE